MSTNLPNDLPTGDDLLTVDDLLKLYGLAENQLPQPPFDIPKSLLLRLGCEGDRPALALVQSLNALAVLHYAIQLREKLTAYDKHNEEHWLDKHIHDCKSYVHEIFSRYGCPLAPCNPLQGTP